MSKPSSFWGVLGGLMGLQDEDEDKERDEDVDENMMRACARVWCSETVGGSSKHTV